MVDVSKIANTLKPYIGVVFLQFGSAGFGIVAKAALNQGGSHYTFSVYRNLFAAVLLTPFALVLERKVRPTMTLSIFFKILLLCLFDPVIGQNMFYAGMKYSSATYAGAMCNLLPALTFLMAWILRVEKVNLRNFSSHAKIAGTIVTVGGAMIMTLVVGPVIGLPWTKTSHHNSTNPNDQEDPLKGAIMIGIGCLGYALFYTVQAITLKSYPAGLSLTSLICSIGALLGTVLTFAVEKGNSSIWKLGWDAKLLAYVYGGVVSSGITYYLSGVIMKEKGPVFVTAFNPLSMVIIAILSSFIFAEKMTVGKVTGAAVIVIGLYLVILGKNKDQREMELVIMQDKQSKGETKASGDEPQTIITGANAV